MIKTYFPAQFIYKALCMRYVLTFSCLDEQIIDVEIHSYIRNREQIWRLPYWRPGRYEQQRYDMNINGVGAKDLAGNELEVRKISSHSWKVIADEGTQYSLRYKYYANRLDAGGSYVDLEMIYVNGINLLLYDEDLLDKECELNIYLPEGFQINGHGSDHEISIQYDHYHQMVDDPFVASVSSQFHAFQLGNLEVNISVHGATMDNLAMLSESMKAFMEAQIRLFGKSPIKQYTYWLIMLPYRYRHGVEHLHSTVIVMGPWYRLHEPGSYDSLLEICCHEFFHVWNVKTFRPRELTPYSYKEPVYSRLHYITEGVTTYYGYAMLWRSGVWTFQDWVKSLNEEFASFFRSGGKHTVSLEQASFNSWVNGYHNKGIPNNRISFYTKGHLVALLMDFYIRSETKHTYSLDDVMRALYQYCEHNQQGYNRQEFQQIFSEITGLPFESFYQSYIAGVDNLLPMLQRLGEFLGLKIIQTPFETVSESILGMKVQKSGEKLLVQNFLPGSVLIQSGIVRGDQLMAMEGYQIGSDWDEMLIAMRGRKQVKLHFFHLGKLKEITLDIPKSYSHTIPQFMMNSSPGSDQLSNRKAWAQTP